MRAGLLAVIFCATLIAGCGDTQNQVGPLAASSPASSTPGLPVPSPYPVVSPHPIPCSGSIGNAGDSSLTVSGACQLTVRAPLLCQRGGGELPARLQQALPSGAQVTISIDFEQYHGPDTYANVQIYFQVTEGTTRNYWSNRMATATVEQGESAITAPRTTLQAAAGTTTPQQPVLISGTMRCTAAG